MKQKRKQQVNILFVHNFTVITRTIFLIKRIKKIPDSELASVTFYNFTTLIIIKEQRKYKVI